MDKYKISGMSCASCQAKIEKKVSSIDGVNNCSVSLLTNQMIIDGNVSSNKVIDAVNSIGYGIKLISDNEKDDDGETKKIINRIIPSIVTLIILMYFSMGYMMFNFPLPRIFENYIILGITQMILSFIIILINRRFYISGFKGALNKSTNMDTLISLGSGISFIYSVIILIMVIYNEANNIIYENLHYYFETSAMILVFVSIGKALEAYSKGKTTNALNGLIDLKPKYANVLRDNKEITIKASEVKIDDIFVVKIGESIPVDGIIIDGSSAIDERSLTGEAIPKDKGVNDVVYASTINKTGYIKCKATHTLDETLLSKIIKMVSDSSNSKAPIAKIADKISAIFVPVILLISLITFIVWFIISKNFENSIMHSISVLVISCPCALGLATPVCIMVSSGKGAKNGILFKNAESLEICNKVDTIVLDKTGTITLGVPVVTDVIAYIDEDELLKYAYSLESKSEHPLAKAINEYALNKGIDKIEVDKFVPSVGMGVSGIIDNKMVVAGNYKFISGYTILNDDQAKIMDNLSLEGKTVIIFLLDNKIIGMLALRDLIKEDSKKAINELKKLGKNIYMLTGDNSKAANAIANEVGIKNVISDVLPDEKENVVNELKKSGIVMMVGDGINDAPALISANLGVGIGGGSDIAIDSSDIILINDSLMDLVKAIRLSKYTIINIYENLFWAFIYNIICIPLAMGIYGLMLMPMYGAISMSISSICVVLNALRLNYKKLEKEVDFMEKELIIDGMMCEKCEAHVKQALEAVDGVIEASANRKKKKAIIKLSKEVNNADLIKAISDAGYELKEIK